MKTFKIIYHLSEICIALNLTAQISAIKKAMAVWKADTYDLSMQFT